MKTKFSLFAYGQDPATGLNFNVNNFHPVNSLEALESCGDLLYPKRNAYHLMIEKDLYFIADSFLEEFLKECETFDYEDSFWNLSPCSPSDYLKRKADRYSHIELSNDKNYNEITIEDLPIRLKRVANIVFNASYVIWGKNRYNNYVQMATGSGEFVLCDLYDQVLEELARV